MPLGIALSRAVDVTSDQARRVRDSQHERTPRADAQRARRGVSLISCHGVSFVEVCHKNYIYSAKKGRN